MRVSTIVIDDDLRALNRLKELLKKIDEVDLIGSYSNSHEGLDAVKKTRPKLVLLDIEMPDLDGFEVLDKLQLNISETSIIITSGYDHYAIKAFRKGVVDYLTKPISLIDLKGCIQRLKRKKLYNLNSREQEIIDLLCEGLNSREIGERLFLSKNTIDTYRRKILEKTDCQNTAAVVKLFASIL